MPNKITLKYKEEIIYVTITSNNIHIEDSYRITDDKAMQILLEKVIKKAAEYNITYKRTIKSWINEWKAHNWLFTNKVKEANTKSVDLNEDESKIRLVGYWFISKFLY